MITDYYVDYTYDNERTYNIERRCVEIGVFLTDHKSSSVRKLAREFGISKSQVHRDLHRLRTLNDDLYVQCMNILKKHKRRYKGE